MKRKKRISYIILAFLTAVAAAAASIVICYSIVRGRGEKSLYQGGQDKVSQLTTLTWQGKKYRYKEDLLNFLVMGIDTFGEVSRAADGISGGQSDAMLLLVLDPKESELVIIAINRDTMTDVDVYDENGFFLGTVKAQITLQHGYGDGMELSCDRSVKAVSGLFRGLPVHGYCSFNMGAIPTLNDAVGGVTVTVPEDLPPTNFCEGEVRVLRGMDAYWYVRARNKASFNSAGRRLERQKQYLSAFLGAAKQAVKKDPALLFSLYRQLQKYMVTDVDGNELIYLAEKLLSLDVDDIRFVSLPGTTVAGEEFEEFYLDEDAFSELLLEVFYEEAE